MYGSSPAETPAKDLNRSFQMSSGLLRYRSAPSSMLGEVCEDFRPSSPETVTMFARLLWPDPRLDKNLPPPSPAAGSASGVQRKPQFPPPAPPPVQPAAAAEENHSMEMMYSHHQMMTPSSMAMDPDHQIKDGGNCSNLIRHSSSPAGLFANLNVENGYGVMRFKNENESIGGYAMNSWEESPILPDNSFSSGLKRSRDNQTEHAQNGEVRNGFSLLKTSSEMAAIEKFLQFQDSVPCKIRAKRGCATHPRSIAERVRRTRISERMRKLQELVPNMDKQTNTSDMLDLAVDYIKDLQKHVKALSDSRGKCSCSNSKQKPYTNSSV